MPATQTHLIPIAELSVAELSAIRNQTIKAITDLAVREMKVTDDQLVVRDIRPASDLDFATEDWYEVTGVTINAYETVSTGTMGADRYVGIYGVMDSGGPSSTLLRFNVGGSDKVIWDLQHLAFNPNNDDRVGISAAAVIIPQSQPYTISRYVRLISSSSHIVLKGFVLERRGRVISP